MKRVSLPNVLKPEILTRLVSWIGWPAIGLYFACMVVVPTFRGGFRWKYLEDVWDNWQSLNVGMLALVASVIAFEATRYKENMQRRRDFLAARAFLPASLSELCGYFKKSAAVYCQAWEDAGARARVAPIVPALPQVPSTYKSVFAECIKHAEPEVGDVLASILSKLQVQDARMRDLINDYKPTRPTIHSYLYALGELQTLVNKLFPFARGEEGFDSTGFSWDEFHNAYKNLDIDVGDYEFNLSAGTICDLTTFTRRAIARQNGEPEPEYRTR